MPFWMFHVATLTMHGQHSSDSPHSTLSPPMSAQPFSTVRFVLKATRRVVHWHPLFRPECWDVERTVDVRWGDGPDDLADVYMPRKRLATHVFSGPPWPVVFYLHGGGFRFMSKDTHVGMAVAFARRGCLVVVPNYRLAPTHPYPAAVEDACRAFTWLTSHAPLLGGDLGRLVLAGESAGANLAAAVAIATTFERPEPWARTAFETGVTARALVPASGLFQTSDLARLTRATPSMPSWVSRRLTNIENQYLAGPKHDLDLADPVRFLESAARPSRPLPATFLSVGTRDPLLPDTKRMRRALAKRGVPVSAKYYKGEIHAFHAVLFRKAAMRCWDDTFEFLRAHVPAR
jgi:acetyl esterase